MVHHGNAACVAGLAFSDSSEFSRAGPSNVLRMVSSVPCAQVCTPTMRWKITTTSLVSGDAGRVWSWTLAWQFLRLGLPAFLELNMLEGCVESGIDVFVRTPCQS